MRMRPHIMVVARLRLHRAEVVEEDKRPHRLALSRRQQAPHHKTTAEVVQARLQDLRLMHEVSP